MVSVSECYHYISVNLNGALTIVKQKIFLFKLLITLDIFKDDKKMITKNIDEYAVVRGFTSA